MKTKIQELRKERGVTQEGQAAGGSVWRPKNKTQEGGRYKASLVLAHKLAQFFGVTIEDIFIFDEEDENL